MTTLPRINEKLLPPETVARLTGFGMASSADGYVFRPTTVSEIRGLFELAQSVGRKVVLRGAGQSYGDANLGAECVIIDLTRMKKILSWDPKEGLLEAEPGVTIEDVWRKTLEVGWWPPVVSGTMAVTLGGALAMNIHGKNAFAVGTLGEHVQDIEVLFPNRTIQTLTPSDELFYAAIGSAGLLGAIVRVKLKLKRVQSGNLRVLPLSCANWDEQFAAFERLDSEPDYKVSWIDCFAGGKSAGRGLFHAAWYAQESNEGTGSLRPENQDLPSKMLGVFPKSMTWRMLWLLNDRLGMRMVNSAKYRMSRLIGNKRPYPQSLVGFSFLLDYVPNWRWAYRPDGFIQYQSFVPEEHAKRVFALQIEMQQQAKLESFLAVMKRHRTDKFLFSHGVKGYSLALDFKVTRKNRERLWELCHRMNDLVLNAGGRFYFAKDSTLRPEDARKGLGEDALRRFKEYKKNLDPNGLLTSELAKRLKLAS